MGRLGWQLLLLVPLAALMYTLARWLRGRRDEGSAAHLPRFLAASVLVHVGLLFALDLVLISIPVVEAHRELIETVIEKTFAILPASETTERRWSEVREGPPPAEPANEAAAPSLATALKFTPEVRGIAATIPDAEARALPAERLMFVPPREPTAIDAPTSELPRRLAMVTAAPDLTAPPSPPKASVPEHAPEPRSATLDRAHMDLAMPDAKRDVALTLALRETTLEPPRIAIPERHFDPVPVTSSPELPAPRLSLPEPLVLPREERSDVAAGLALRRAELRKDVVAAMGGTEASEAAVALGLKWLVAHQASEGNWSLHDLHCQGHHCGEPGTAKVDAAATGLALMALLGAGNSSNRGPHASAVARGSRWLVEHQQSNGDLAGDGPSQMYGHALATIALCEAYALSGDEALRPPAMRALAFIVAAQDPKTGGWRYHPRGGGDTSVFGWQLMALKSGEMAGMQVPSETYRLAAKWLDAVRTGPGGTRYGYRPGRSATPPMTAEALLCRQYLGVARDDPGLRAGGEYLNANPPGWKNRNSYYWYYATQVMFHLQGEPWTAWNARVRDLLVEAQAKDGVGAGSWHPKKPSADIWADRGGRLYETALSLLMLEVYYRHLPLYRQLASPSK
jgi:hypothetical protein